MDKLEKALQKAREQRAHATGKPQGQNQTTTQRASYVKTNQSNLVSISDIQMDRARIVAHKTQSKEADTFRILRTQVLQIMNNDGLRSLAITSPRYSDGKTTIALNLAISIALDLKQTVLLVDLDFRKPNLHEFLGYEPSAGLTDYLFRNTPIPDCMIRLSFERMTVLPAGSPVDQSSEAIGLPKMAALARELKTRYPDRFIIYDMPPVLEQDDPLAFMPNVDSVLLVAREGKTKPSEIAHTVELLSSARIIGTVLNEKL
ncbi:MAG: exopolysaccharide biosynthesis protein [Proteobacteria bacterium]|jgi:capsular exopolysaccharide synthesis family protein|nr:CpsD/CapB family tyrosine-protein kinase [Alphaproteobacteria bacterium]NCC02686.1 exopolysaccharide biosynthesis protein [Pseudomonadota bacterium]